MHLHLHRIDSTLFSLEFLVCVVWPLFSYLESTDTVLLLVAHAALFLLILPPVPGPSV